MPRIRHSQDECAVFHVTTRTLAQEFHLRPAGEKHQIIKTLDFYRRRGRFRLLGFVVMDNHVHMLIAPSVGRRLSDIIRDWKVWTSRRNRSKPAGEPLWERRFDDNRIDTSRELREVLEYIHDNPVRAGVVGRAEEYPWSSVHNYLSDARAAIEVDTDWWEPSL
jgi:REP element-mobilizing transposase RayT